MGERVVILSGGHRAGLICLDPRTGEMLWNVPCGEASYATPVLATFAGVPQIIFMTPESIRGVDARRGEALWEYPLAEGGLTNVPTPIVDAEDGLIISGQGIKGTRKLQITRIDREWTVTELWKNRVQFFYCNWLLDGDRLLGCDGDRLLALDKRTGQTLGRWRGYADSNLLRAGSSLLVLCGNGELAVMRSQADALEFVNGFQTMEARCWTPPTWIGDRLVVRGDDQLACLDWQSEDPACPVVERKQPSNEKLVWDSDRGAAPPLDSVSKISAAFQNGGQEAALELYNQLRMTTPTSLSLEDRRELARMAESEGLADLVRLLAEHAVEQFPESRVAREWLAELTPRVDSPHPPPASHRGENGLLYIEVALRNNSVAFIETCVKGPAKHPFSYGMTFAPGKIRRETWPIGTRLYQTNDGARTKLLVELQVDDAGQTLSLFE